MLLAKIDECKTLALIMMMIFTSPMHQAEPDYIKLPLTLKNSNEIIGSICGCLGKLTGCSRIFILKKARTNRG